MRFLTGGSVFSASYEKEKKRKRAIIAAKGPAHPLIRRGDITLSERILGH